jgi:hypothetical protein
VDSIKPLNPSSVARDSSHPVWRVLAALDLDGQVALTLREIWGLVENALCADVVRRFTRRFKDTPRSLAPLAGLRHGRRSLAPCGSLLSTGQVEKWGVRTFEMSEDQKWMRPETGFDHTLITPQASVGVIGAEKSDLHLPGISYLRLVRTASGGSKRFRFPLYRGAEHTPDLIACVSTRRSRKRQMHSGPEFVGLYRQCPPWPPDSPTQLPTQNSYPWYSVPPILLDGGRGGRI